VVLRQLKALLPALGGLYDGDWLRTWDKSQSQVEATYLVARALEILYVRNVSCRVYSGAGVAVSIFRDQSTRTRSSFAGAAAMLGLSLMDMDETKSQIAHGETVRETAAMISFNAQAVGIRDDLFVGEGHRYMKLVAETVAAAYAEKVIPQIPAVVNLQCDEDHPTQAMADLMHLAEYFGGLEKLKGKKLVMSWAYSPSYGKPLSVPQAIIALMSRFGMNIVLAHPEGYGLLPEIVEHAKKHSESSGGTFEICHDMKKAFVSADVVYPKSWAALTVMQERVSMLRAGKAGAEAIKELDKRAIAESQKYIDWQCTPELMATTKEGKALYMHCLPADISGVSCARGEVAAEVFEKYRVDTYKEAGHKPYVIAAMILMNRFPDTHKLLNSILARNEPRVFGL
jgi:knotted carbamoyltransferase YgeW